MKSVDNLKVLIYMNICCILPNYQQIANGGWFYDSTFQYKLYGIIWPTQNIETEMKNTANIRK